MTHKTHTVRSNAVRAARSVLGKDAKQGVHFTISGEKGAFAWSKVDGAPEVAKIAAAANATEVVKAPRKPRKKAIAINRIKAKVRAKVANKVKGSRGRRPLEKLSDITGQKRLKMLHLISGPNGESLDNLSAKLDWQRHTVRGAVSTLGSEFKVKIKSYKDEKRGRVYRVTGGANAARVA